MARFSEIIGHGQIKEHLLASIQTDKVNHAYLLQGQSGSGKRLLADAFAQALQCEQKDSPDACGSCRSCRQASGGNHPDIIYVRHEKPGTISVDEIRHQVVADIQIKPYQGPYKIYIMEDAERMNPAAQNALLKTLEEPPAYAVIILLAVNASLLLETIRSRCVLLDLKPVQDSEIEAYLMSHLEIPDYQAKLCTAFAQGSIGRAVEFASSPDFAQIRQTALLIASKARDMDITQIINIVKDLSQYKISTNDFLDILTVWYRDVLYFKATRQPDQLVFRDQLQQIREAARISSYEGIEQILEGINKAKARLDANVQYDLTMELLFMTIKEN